MTKPRDFTLDEIAEKYFKYVGVNVYSDGHTSYKVYECNRCKHPISYQQVKEHYEIHKNYEQG